MLKKITLYTAALLAANVLFNSCKKDYESIESIDEAKMQAYIKQNNLTMTKDPSGFYYQVVSNGTGVPFANKDSVFYELKASSLTGVGYYSTPAYSVESNVVGYLSPPAYRIALAGTNRGAKIRVLLPSYLAYGKNGYLGVPPNEVILAELTTRPETAQWVIEDELITNYLAANNITAVKSPSRVYYKINTAGTGETIDIGSNVTVKFVGRLLNGTIFDQATGDQSWTFAMTGGAIKGFDVLLGMKVGTKLRMYIPSDLAYGSLGNGPVPPNSILDFEVEIVSLTN